jgi:hypothetical protein
MTTIKNSLTQKRLPIKNLHGQFLNSFMHSKRIIVATSLISSRTLDNISSALKDSCKECIEQL